MKTHTYRPEKSLYVAGPYCLIRTPSFPIEAYLEHSANFNPDTILHDRQMKRALAVGSMALLEEFDRQSLHQRDIARRERKLMRYLIRMTTRPTPYGLFAGIALGKWGDHTDLGIMQPMAHIQARPDMEWLLSLVQILESSPDVRSSLKYFANTAAHVYHNRVYVIDRTDLRMTNSAKLPSVRATNAVLQVLALCRRPISYTDLCETLLANLKDATLAKVEKLIDELWRTNLLFTDLRPSLTGEPFPAWQLLRKLEALPPTLEIAKKFQAILTMLDAWGRLPAADAPKGYTELTGTMKEFLQGVKHDHKFVSIAAHDPLDETPDAESDDHADPVIQVDTTHSMINGVLAQSISEDIIHLTELLIRFSAFPDGFSYLDKFRDAFINRYGVDREVPLLEVLNPHIGIGPLEGRPGKSEPTLSVQKRQQILFDIASQAMYDRQLSLELDDELSAQLETVHTEDIEIPDSLDISVFIAASSQEALNSGDYHVILGPNLGGLQAGRTFGRFASLFENEGTALLREIVVSEEKLHPEALSAELVYLSTFPRKVNMMIRPSLHSHELAFGCLPGTDFNDSIPFNELVIGLRANRFYVYWPQKATEVRINARHMLNSLGAPSLIRFLDWVSYDKRTLPTWFDWGSARSLPVLPRIHVGRIVLALAQWNITTYTREKELLTRDREAFYAALALWRTRWQVPRYVYMGKEDNRLLLDLENPHHCEEVRQEIHKLTADERVTMEEALPAPNQAWAEGEKGHFLVELNMPLVRRSPDRHASTAQHPVHNISSVARYRATGSDWLFMKIYCSADLQERLIGGTLLTLANEAVHAEWAEKWFFIRYADPDPHIRLRFQGDPSTLVEKLIPVLCDWGNHLIHEESCSKFTFDVYDREIERYGGLEAISLTESIFYADSRMCSALIFRQQANQLSIDPILLAAISTDQLLRGIGANPERLRDWSRKRVRNRKQGSLIYQKYNHLLRKIIGQPAKMAFLEGNEPLTPIFESLSNDLLGIAEQLANLDREQKLTQSIPSLYSSLMHMHCNRLLGTQHSMENDAIGILTRSYESLMHRI